MKKIVIAYATRAGSTAETALWIAGRFESAGFLAEKFHLEGPLKNENTTFSLSARGMHTFLFDRVIKWAGSPLNYAFYDVNAKVLTLKSLY